MYNANWKLLEKNTYGLVHNFLDFPTIILD